MPRPLPVPSGGAATADEVRHGQRRGQHHGHKFRRALGHNQLALLTLGSIMGSGLFLASGQAIRQAGPGVLLAFAAGIAVMAFESGVLAEMSAADPVPGAFLTYARRVFGARVAFAGGWLYWFSSVLGLAAEAVAAGTFARFWLPGLPLWVPSLGFALAMVAVNFAPVRGFGLIESLMAGVKVAVAAGFVLVGGFAAISHLVRSGPGVLPGLVAARASGPLPWGTRGVAGTMLLVMFSLAGTGSLGLAAAEATHPERTVPAAIRRLVAAIGFLYLGSLGDIMLWLPWRGVPVQVESPFVAALAALGLSWTAGVFNLVLLTAVLSALGASLFATNRVLYTLARDGHAPAGLARLTRYGVPGMANVASAAALVTAVLLSWYLPRRAFVLLVSATGFQAMFIWLLVVATHVVYRPILERERGALLPFRIPGHPWLDYLAIVLILAILATAPLGPGQVPALLVGLGVVAVLVVAYEVVRVARRPRR